MSIDIEKILSDNLSWEKEEKVKLETGEEVTIHDLRQIFNKIQDKTHWKNPICASVHHSQVNYVFAAIEYFHADKATIEGIEQITGNVIITGRGYQAY